MTTLVEGDTRAPEVFTSSLMSLDVDLSLFTLEVCGSLLGFLSLSLVPAWPGLGLPAAAPVTSLELLSDEARLLRL